MGTINTKKAFLNALSELSHSLPPEKLQVLEGLLTQPKDEAAILHDIVATFPSFTILYQAELAEQTYL